MDQVLPHRRTHIGYARRLTGREAEAEDVVQEAYTRIFASADWRRIGNAHAFTMRTVHNVAVERFRRAGVVQMDQALRLDTFDPADERPSPERETMARDELRQVAEALERLPERCGEVFRLRRIDGFSTTQIAYRLGISVSTVEKHLVKGLRLLTEMLRDPPQGQETGHVEPWLRKGRRTGS